MSFSYMVFIIDRTQLDRSRQFSFGFGIDQTNTIGHVIVLSGFCHRLDMVALFHFWHRLHLYDQSCSSPI